MIKPLNDYIILKPLSKEEVTESGIILPDTVDKDRPEQGEIVAVGPGKLMEDGKRSAMEVQVGQKVMFKKYTPDEIEVEKEKLLVIRMDDVVGIIE
jgi:chaperonin GroES